MTQLRWFIALAGWFQLASWRYLAICAGVLLGSACLRGEEPSWTFGWESPPQPSPRLCLVIDLPINCLSTDKSEADWLAYRAFALSPRETSTRLIQNWAVRVRFVGGPSSLKIIPKPKAANTETRPDHTTVAYLCTPDQRVLHIVPGIPSAAELLQSLIWSEQTYAKLPQLALAEQVTAVRAAHLGAVRKPDHDAFQHELARAGGALVREPSRNADFPTALVAANRLRYAKARARIAPLHQELPPAIAAAIAQHAELDRNWLHLALSEQPLPRVDDIAKTCYETLATRYWAPGHRRAELRKRAEQSALQVRPMLLVVRADSLPPFLRANAPLAPWPAENEKLFPRLGEFDVCELSLDELAVLAFDLQLPPQPIRNGDPPRFVVVETSGKQWIAVTQSESLSLLSRRMDSVLPAASPQP